MKFIEDIEEDPLIAKPMSRLVREWSRTDQDDSDGYRKHMADYHRTIRRRLFFIVMCVVVTVVAAGYAIAYGPLDISFADTYITIWNHITGNVQNAGMDFIIVNVRAPRIVAGIFGGIGLAVCGAVLQSVLRNPLADSYTTGVSSGASFGATLAITMGLSVVNSTPTVIMAFVFSLLPIVAIILLSKHRSASSPTVMIMFGIGLMYIFNALTTVFMLWSSPEDLASIYQWQVGSLAKVTWDNILYMAAVVIVGTIVIQILSGKLNVLATGDDNAKALGIDPHRLRVFLLAVTGLICAGVVSFTGVIGFVGLVTPHIVRIFIGADNRYLLPASALFGAMLMVVCDLLGRAVLDPAVLPVGVVMAFIGGPTFIWLLVRKGNSAW
ncbi:MAG: iron ABC transporter permease [Candidatus Methanomethylophilaceae archaeon]|nr:iron ABC transporter permease [Candidatus Methanomethylophilaceae archaeon]